MNETYTVQQAMDRLGLKSPRALYSLENKYPEAFVVVKQTKRVDQRKKGTQYHYDKATLDRFAERREHFRQE